MTTGNLCYVLGCYDARATQSAQHRHFGRVATCDSHHPDRGGIGVGFGSLDAPVAPAAPVAVQKPAGGTRQPLTVSASPDRPKPVLPPSGLAQVTPEVARERIAAARARAVASAAQAGGAL
jgi:hypothetical protein